MGPEHEPMMQHVGHLFWDSVHDQIREVGRELLRARASSNVQSVLGLLLANRIDTELRPGWDRIVYRYGLRDGIQARNESDWFKL